MIPEQIENKELDIIIRNVLSSNDDLIIPNGLAEKTIRKLEKKILLKELVIELLMKIGLISASLAILVGVFALVNMNGVFLNLITLAINYSHITISIVFLTFITFAIDQVGLKFYYTIQKKTSMKIL